MLLIDYPAAGKLLGADGALKPRDQGARGIMMCQREGQVGKWGWRGGGRREGRGGGEGPEFLIWDWHLHPSLREDLLSGALDCLSA